jgi:hypothetical protein
LSSLFATLFSQNKIPPKKEVSEMTKVATNLMKMVNLKNL